MITSPALTDQLLRYAEDLGSLLSEHKSLVELHEDLAHSHLRLNARQDHLERLLNASRDIYLNTDREGRILGFNPAAAAFLNQVDPTGLLLGEKVPALARRLEEMRLQGGGEMEMAIRDPRGGERVLCVRVMPGLAVPGSDQEGLEWLMYQDDTADSIGDAGLSASTFQVAGEGIMITDVAGVIIAVNPAFTRITGYAFDEVVGKTPSLLKSGLQKESFYREFWETLQQNGRWQGEIYNRRKGGDIYPQWLTVTRTHAENGEADGYIAVFTDVSGGYRVEQQLAAAAQRDSLTGLPNRGAFLDRLNLSVALARRTEQPLALMCLDLDDFRELNRERGPRFCDRLLQQVANRLQGVLRESDTLSRLGGDEFGLILPGVAQPGEARRVADKLMEALAAPFGEDDDPLFLGLSIGCARYPADTDSAAGLLLLATEASYQSRREGGGRLQQHTEE